MMGGLREGGRERELFGVLVGRCVAVAGVVATAGGICEVCAVVLVLVCVCVLACACYAMLSVYLGCPPRFSSLRQHC